MQAISPQEALALMEQGAPYLDVRSEEEFGAGHPAGAFNLPISEGDFASTAQACFPKDAPIIVGCKSGHRSLIAARALEEEGFTHVFEQHAGWDGTRDAFGRITEPGWRRVGLPSHEGTDAERSYAALRARTLQTTRAT